MNLSHIRTVATFLTDENLAQKIVNILSIHILYIYIYNYMFIFIEVAQGRAAPGEKFLKTQVTSSDYRQKMKRIQESWFSDGRLSLVTALGGGMTK